MSRILLCVVAVVLVCASLVVAHGGHGHSHGHSHEAGGSHEGHDSHVLDLTADNFDATVAANELLLVEFFAPWCGHCKKLAPEYEEAAHRLEGSKSKLAKVDCTEQKDLCSRFDVKGFPTIKLFRNDGSAPSEYPSGRTADAITTFMNKQSSPAYVDVSTVEEVKAKFGTEVVAVGFFAGQSGAEYDAFIKVAKTLRNEYTFVTVTGSTAASVAQAFDAEVPDVVVFKPFSEPAAEFDGSYTVEAIADFIKAEAFPLVGEIGPENYQKYLERGLPLVWLFIDKTPDDATTASVLAAAQVIALATKGSLSFVQLDGQRWADHAKNFGLSGATPGVVIEDREDGKNYVLSQATDFSQARLQAHVDGYLDGSLPPTVKSQEIPTDNDGPVHVVVGKSYESVVLDDSKDVFLEFYAPWCGHCKSLAPRWEKLGEMFQHVPTVVIAKIDATENDTPFKVQGFPTLVFFPAGGKKSPITYSGERTEEAMAEFVRKNGNTLKGASAPTAGAGKKKGHDEL